MAMRAKYQEGARRVKQLIQSWGWRGGVRGAGMGIATALLAASCALQGGRITDQVMLEEFYGSQLGTLRTLDRAFFSLGQELAVLEIEYAQLAEPELARLSGRRAAQFHRDHLRIQADIRALEAKLVRVQRGEDPGMVFRETPLPTPTPTPSPTPAPVPTLAPRITPRPMLPPPAPPTPVATPPAD